MNQNDPDKDEELEKIRKKKFKNLANNLRTPPQKTDNTVNLTTGKVILLNGINFWEKIRENTKVLVDCYADWCFPCKRLEPIFAQLAQTYRNILFCRINIDHAPTITNTFQIRSIPLILFFRQGELVHKLVGALPYNTIQSHIQKHLG